MMVQVRLIRLKVEVEIEGIAVSFVNIDIVTMKRHLFSQ